MANKQFSRRDFIQAWGGATCGSIYLPSLASLLYSSIVHGGPQQINQGGELNCPTIDLQNLPPAFIALDLAGGAGIPGNNVMVYKAGGEDLLRDYSYLLPDRSPPKVNEELGLAFHQDSGMLAGIKKYLGGGFKTIADKVNGCVICTKSSDDTKDNPLATAPGVFLAGAQGAIVPLIGNKEGGFGDSGGNSRTAFVSGVAPTLVKDFETAKALLKKDDIWTAKNSLENTLKAIENLSSSQLERFSQLSLPEQAKAMLNESYKKAGELLNYDPRCISYQQDNQLPNFGGWPSKEIPAQTLEEVKQVAYMILKGFAGAGTITIDGYDYHDGSASKGYNKDLEAGNAIGAILKMADALQRKLMLHVYTDGGVSPSASKETEVVGNANRLKWTGDSEVHSADFVLVYDPAGQVKLQHNQLGGFKDENSSIDLTPSQHERIAGSPENEAHVVVANWLSWAKKSPGSMANNPIRGNELDNYLFIPS